MKEIKSLGVIVDEGLNWEEQFKIFLPQSQLSNVYRDLVESHMRYEMLFGVASKIRKRNPFNVFKAQPSP